MYRDSTSDTIYPVIFFVAENIRYYRRQADLHKIFPHENVGMAYRNACSAVQAMKPNETYIHENHRLLVERIFSPTHKNYPLYGADNRTDCMLHMLYSGL